MTHHFTLLLLEGVEHLLVGPDVADLTGWLLGILGLDIFGQLEEGLGCVKHLPDVSRRHAMIRDEDETAQAEGLMQFPADL